MLDFYGTPTPERKLIPIFGKSNRIPETHGCLNAQLILKSPQWRIGVACPVTPSRACQAILEEHADDRHHGKSAICNLRVQPASLGVRVVCGKQWRFPSHVSWCVVHVCIVAGLDFCEPSICNHLNPTCEWNLADGSESVWNVCKLQVLTGRQEAWPFSSELRRDVAHGCKHANAAMLDFYGTPTPERKLIPIFGKSNRIPETNGCLNAQLILKSPQWRTGVACPVTPSRA